MIYTCKLENISFFAFHGLYPQEQKIGGTFIVNVEVSRNSSLDETFEDLNKLYNYELLFQIAKKEMQQTQALIETVAKNIFEEINSTLKPEKLSVSVTKLNPAGLFGSGVATVSLTL